MRYPLPLHLGSKNHMYCSPRGKQSRVSHVATDNQEESLGSLGFSANGL